MSKRDLAGMDADMFTPIGRMLQQAMSHGINNNIIHGGLVSGQTALQSVYAYSATKNCTLGTTMLEVETGRGYVYSQAGATQLEKGLMTQALAPVANYLEEVQAVAWTAGDLSGTATITTGATPAANYFEDGWLIVNKLTGLGYAYPILSNTSHATTITVVLKPGYPIIVTTDATTEFSLIKSPFKQTIVVPTTTQTAQAAGVPPIVVPIDNYFWAQVKGPCPMIVDTGETLVIGEGVANGDTVAGAANDAVTLKTHWGNAMTIGAAGEYALVNLNGLGIM